MIMALLLHQVDDLERMAYLVPTLMVLLDTKTICQSSLRKQSPKELKVGRNKLTGL